MPREMPEVELKKFLMHNKLIAKYNEQEVYLDHESETYYHITQKVVDEVISGTLYGEYENLGEASHAAAKADQFKEKMLGDNGSIVSVGGLVTELGKQKGFKPGKVTVLYGPTKDSQ